MQPFQETCSIYANNHDARGMYRTPDIVDYETGEITTGHTLTRLTIYDFLLSGAFGDMVASVRELADAADAVKRRKHADIVVSPEEQETLDEYNRRKGALPSATLSALFSYRKGACLLRHTGYIVLDIDLGDNRNLANFDNIMFVLRQQPEIAIAMRSCSGKGYLALARLALPTQLPQPADMTGATDEEREAAAMAIVECHKSQARALQRKYRNLGITLDSSCSDVTRLRFASYDTDAYVNPAARPFTVALAPTAVNRIAPIVRHTPRYNRTETEDTTVDKVERLVRQIEQRGINIVPTYDQWIRVGFALRTLGDAIGREYFHRISRIDTAKYSPANCDYHYNSLTNPNSTIGTFIAICRDCDVTLR